MKIGIDIDGIILDFERTMRTLAELYDLFILNKMGIVNKNEFSYLDRYDWTKEEKDEFVKEYLVYATVNLTPLIPLAKELLEFLNLEGYEYYFITARGTIVKETKNAIIDVFNRNSISINNICFGIKDKVDACKKIGIDIMVDDNPNICKKLQKNRIKTLYFRDKDNDILTGNEYLKEVSNVGEIIRFIAEENGLKNKKEVYQKLLKK